MKVRVVLGVFLLVCGTVSLAAAPAENTWITTSAELGVRSVDDDQITRDLAEVAPVFARVVHLNPDILWRIREKTNERFDGDYDVLFADLDRSLYKSGWSSLTDLLCDELPLKVRRDDFRATLKRIPHFNVYLYVPDDQDRDSVDLTEAVVVANRYDVSDLEEFEVIGYDRHGVEVVLNSQQPPDFPLIVLGINERVDAQGVHPGFKSDAERLSGIYLETDNEGWLSGNPEVRAWYVWPGAGPSYSAQGMEREYTGVNDTGYWYGFDEYLFNLADVPQQQYFEIVLWEYDPEGSYDWFPIGFGYWYSGQNYEYSWWFLGRTGYDFFGPGIIYRGHVDNQIYDLGEGRVKFKH